MRVRWNSSGSGTGRSTPAAQLSASPAPALTPQSASFELGRLVEATCTVEHFAELGAHLDCELFVAREDLLPFPLAGSAVRKLAAELALPQATAADVLAALRPDLVVVASATGTTLGGIAAAVEPGTEPTLRGVSITRSATQNPQAASAAVWAGGTGSGIVFDDRFHTGGHDKTTTTPEAAAALGWSYGLPLDPWSTGRAFAALVDRRREGQRVLFWHTGGLMHFLTDPSHTTTAGVNL